MIKIDVPYIDQSVKYPTGCESVSAVMLLQYLGVSVTVDEFIEKYLELSGFEEKNGELYGPNPYECFCGSPYDEESFGCYAPVICRALQKAAGDDYEIIDETGTPVRQLLENYVDQGMPVISGHASTCVNQSQDHAGSYMTVMRLSRGYPTSTACFWSVMMRKDIISTIHMKITE